MHSRHPPPDHADGLDKLDNSDSSEKLDSSDNSDHSDRSSSTAGTSVSLLSYVPAKTSPPLRQPLRLPLHLPPAVRRLAKSLRRDFLASRDAPADSAPVDEATLLAQFAAFVLEQIDAHDCEYDDHGDREALVQLLAALQSTFEREFGGGGDDVHAVAAALPVEASAKTTLISTMIRVSHLLGTPCPPCSPSTSALLDAADQDRARIFAVFGGQGHDTCLDTLQTLHQLYEPLVAPLLSRATAHLQDLASRDEFRPHFPRGLDILRWITHLDPDTRPATSYLTSAPVSFPLVGLLQLTCFYAISRILRVAPSRLVSLFHVASGHSQGLIVAAFIATSSDWDSFHSISTNALSLLFSIGVRSQEAFSLVSLAPPLVKDAEDHGEGSPSPMLSVRHLPLSTVNALIAQVNAQLPPREAIELGLRNSPTNFVLVGPSTSLHTFNVRLRALKASPSDPQARVPFDKRKPQIANTFLPVSAPFHSSYLAAATANILRDAQDMGVQIRGSDLGCAVYTTTSEPEDLRRRGSRNIVPELVRLITEEQLHWFPICSTSKPTHVLDFGPGRGSSGAGGLVHAISHGKGTRVILATELNGSGFDFGGTAELLQRRLVIEPSWAQQYAPRVLRTVGARTIVSTKMSRLLGLPPVMVAGMTPTTCSVDFVAATMNAGFHIEFAVGGYHQPAALEVALRTLAHAVPSGRGITCNLIYANPTALRWQIPLLRRLSSEEGLPIDGLTFGAGVPSLDVANDYIQTFAGLKHISFKPGNVSAIQQVLEIAKANPRFPIILQWTGGRGGGHHSFEDFHQPIARMYGAIRRRENIVLVAGSGMGDADGSFPYLTGEWSSKLHLPFMPFDGILLGSRVMVAKEARTSPAVKHAIVAAQGVDDSQWSKTYDGAAGGVITVISEMGEPIHKLATDGVLLWAELDKTVFSISDKSKRAQVLKQKRNYIISRLNADSHKVWFGWSNIKNKAVGLDEMTYYEVVSRLVALTHVSSRRQWIDESFRALVHDFIHHAASRFITQAFQAATIPSSADLDDPEACMERLLANFPQMDEDFMTYQDIQFFLALCRRKGQKPVPFVPALDENFETWFKKDSLWQSEDLESVVGQDVRRVCILQGPVAVRHSTTVDEPIKDILTGLHDGYIGRLLKGQGDLQFVECFGLPEEDYMDRRIADIGGGFGNWRQAFFTSKTLVQGSSVAENPMVRILQGKRTLFSDVGPNCVHVSIVQDGPVQAVRVELLAENVIELRILGNLTADRGSTELLLKFRYDPECGYAPIHEIMDGRNERIRDFYRQVWLGHHSTKKHSIRDEYFQGPTKITARSLKQFMRALKCPELCSGDILLAPMDYGMVAAWKPLVEPLLAHDLSGNLLDLVHVSNSFRLKPGARPLAEGDIVETRSRVTAVAIQSSGKMVEVVANLFREDQSIMEIRSQFLIRGSYFDHESCFQVVDEAPMELQIKSASQVHVLLAKDWLHYDKSFVDMLHVGTKLIFKLQTCQTSDEIIISGEVETKGSQRTGVQVATVAYVGAISKGNPVSNYLCRYGQLEQSPVLLANPVPLQEFTLQVPTSNKEYAVASGDLNPIHLSSPLSQYLGLPGTITHGMHTSARVRLLIERHLCSSDPSSFRSFHCSFVGMVLPGEKLKVLSEHVGMKDGLKIIKIKAVKFESEETVLTGEAEIENGRTAFVFTGQGSQRVGMGMDLYATSEAAREVWDRADQHFLDNYGFLISDIVKNNPKEHVVQFGGRNGRRVRQNYMDLAFLDIGPDGTTLKRRVFPDINEFSPSLTFSSPEGLLSATQFTQPALTLMEIAAFRDLQSRGVVSAESYFAGHSLGEYSALCAVVDVAAIEELMSIVFYRGLTMQYAVKRDEKGRSDFAMVAVNPSRVPNFDGTTLNSLVQKIAAITSSLIEVVNYNVEGQQYICAGQVSSPATPSTLPLANDLFSLQHRALKCLGDILDRAHSDHSIHLRNLVREEQQQGHQPLHQLIDTVFARQQRKGGLTTAPLQRGKATIPLPGIDVPFHSSYLRAGVAPFRHHLSRFIRRKAVDLEKLQGRYVPNVTARPFEVSRSYLEDVWRLTGSEVVDGILGQWDELEAWVPGTGEQKKPTAIVEAVGS